MSMIRRLIQAYANTRPIRPIYHETGLYLKRYYLCTVFGWRVYLHHFMMSDPDGLHNHPFQYSFSIILAGQYLEQTRWGLETKRWFNWIGPDKFHRVILYVDFSNNTEKSITCWSIFAHTKRASHWGFLRQPPNPDFLIYEKVAKDNPTPFSTWYKDAPTGAEWERWSEDIKQTYKEQIEQRYREEATRDH